MNKNFSEMTDVYNPFFSWKVLCWRSELEAMSRGECPVPVCVTIDPTNRCNLNCSFCIMRDIRVKNESIPDDVLLQLPKFLSEWIGVKSVCVGGGGEPFCHSHITELFYELNKYKISTGTITNGASMAQSAIEAVVHSCRWIGFSVDAATPKTWEKIKRSDEKGMFKRVLMNIYWVAQNRRADKRPSIGMKFLFHHYNFHEVYDFIRLAKELGADEAHMRPVAIKDYVFTKDIIEKIEEQIAKARSDFEDENFKVFGIVHKFTNTWERAIRFKKCLATSINAYFLANGTLALCCDRRDDVNLNLGEFYPFSNVLNKWGSKEHREMIAKINPKICPRCTQAITNEIIEKVFINDEMCHEFV